jgi:hypothetical protein
MAHMRGYSFSASFPVSILIQTCRVGITKKAKNLTLNLIYSPADKSSNLTMDLENSMFNVYPQEYGSEYNT